jgi:hypothetical protein
MSRNVGKELAVTRAFVRHDVAIQHSMKTAVIPERAVEVGPAISSCRPPDSFRSATSKCVYCATPVVTRWRRMSSYNSMKRMVLTPMV